MAIDPARVDITRHRSALGQWELVQCRPDPRLASYVVEYQGYREWTPTIVRRVELALPAAVVIINLGPHWRLGDGHAPGRMKHYGSFIAGLYSTYAVSENTGASHCLHPRLSPVRRNDSGPVPANTAAGRFRCDRRRRPRLRLHSCKTAPVTRARLAHPNPPGSAPMRGNTQTSIIPCLQYRDGRAAIEWLGRAFGFEKHVAYDAPDGSVAHAELKLGPAFIMLGSNTNPAFGWKSPLDAGCITQSVYIVLDAIDAIDAHYADAKRAGAEIVRDLTTTDYGSREYSARDPEGHVWHFGTYRPQ